MGRADTNSEERMALGEEMGAWEKLTMKLHALTLQRSTGETKTPNWTKPVVLICR